MSDPSELVLSTVTRPSGANAQVVSGAIQPVGAVLRFVDVPVLVDGFRRMVRELEFDVCEMALTTYLCARAAGCPFTALPIFLVRGFHHQAILVRPNSHIRQPKDLEGCRIGVRRGYTVTTGVWARGILAEEYDLNLDAVTWVRSADEHVKEYVPPCNVVMAEQGTSLDELLENGKIDAIIGDPRGASGLVPLIANPQHAAERAFIERGFYPINHLIVVKDDILTAHPQLADKLIQTFTAAKDNYIAELKHGSSQYDAPIDRLYLRVMKLIDNDPLPYGVEPNRLMLNKLIEFAITQHIIAQSPPIDMLFATAGSEQGGDR
jgi:4,5-dihydroxyphthalate decarboxylase